jgi:RNA polymerase sigma-70 factor
MRRFTLNGAEYFGNSQHVDRKSTNSNDNNHCGILNLADASGRVKASDGIVRWRQLGTQNDIKPLERRPNGAGGVIALNDRRNLSVSDKSKQVEKLLADGAKRLLAHVSDDYGVTQESLAVRIKTAVNKSLLKDDANAGLAAISDFIDKLQADDLCLIVACEHGNQKAWNDLVERFSPTVRSAARSASSNEEGAEDLAQSIWAELYGLRSREDGKPAGKLGYYSGRGSLAGWLRAVVAQLAIDHHRKQSRLVQTEDDADFDRIIGQGHDENDWSVRGRTFNPEVETTQKLAGAEMQKALSSSIQQLSAEDRLLVKLYYFDGLRLREAGALLGVHEATASRRLTRIHTDLRRQVENILIDEKGWTKPETERAFCEIAVHLEADIEQLLANDSVLLKNQNEIAG